MNDFGEQYRRIKGDFDVARKFFTRFDKNAIDISRIDTLESKLHQINKNVKNNEAPYDLYPQPYSKARSDIAQISLKLDQMMYSVVEEPDFDETPNILVQSLNNCFRQNSTLSQEIKDKLAEIGNLQNEIKKQTQNKANLEKQIVRLETDKKQLYANEIKTKTDFDAIKTDLSTKLNEQIRQNEQLKNTFDDQKTKINSEIMGMQIQISDLKQKNTELNNKYLDSKSHRDKIIAQLNAKISIINVKNSALQTRISDLENEIKQQSGLINTRSTELEEMKKTMAQIELERLNLTLDKAQIERKSEEHKNNLLKYIGNFNKLHDKMLNYVKNTFGDAYDNIVKSLAKLNQQHKKYEFWISTHHNIIDNLRNKVANLESEKNNLVTQNNKLLDENKQLQINLTDQKAKFEKFENEMKEKHAVNLNKIDEKTAQISALHTKYNEEIHNLQIDLDKNNKKILALSNLKIENFDPNNTFLDKNSALYNTLIQYKNTLNELKETSKSLSEINSQISKLIPESAKKNAEIDNLKTKNIELNKKITEIEAKYQQKLTDLEAKKAAEIKNLNAELEKKVNKFNEIVEAYKRQISSLKLVRSVETDMYESNKAEQKVMTDLRNKLDINDDLESLKTEQSKLLAEIVQLKHKLAILNNKDIEYKKIDEKNINLESQFAKYNQIIKDQATVINSLNKRLSNKSTDSEKDFITQLGPSIIDRVIVDWNSSGQETKIQRDTVKLKHIVDVFLHRLKEINLGGPLNEYAEKYNEELKMKLSVLEQQLKNIEDVSDAYNAELKKIYKISDHEDTEQITKIVASFNKLNDIGESYDQIVQLFTEILEINKQYNKAVNIDLRDIKLSFDLAEEENEIFQQIKKDIVGQIKTQLLSQGVSVGIMGGSVLLAQTSRIVMVVAIFTIIIAILFIAFCLVKIHKKRQEDRKYIQTYTRKPLQNRQLIY